jgi:hypothetical protein
LGKSLASVLPTVLLAALLLASPGPLLGPAAADIAPPEPPGTHMQHYRSTVELGVWADYTVRFVRLEPGDTFGGIAREHLGSFKRWKEIGELNLLDPHMLPVGGEILLPPRHEPLPFGGAPDPERPDAREWWDFFVLPGVGGNLARYRIDAGPSPWGIGMGLVAIRHDKAAEIVKRVNEDPVGVDAALKALAPTSSAWLARSGDLTRSIRVKDEDPVFRVETHWRVATMDGGRLVLEKVTERLFGVDGKELPKTFAPPAVESDAITDGVAGPPARWDLILTFLALLAAIGIAVVYAQRARRRATGEPASSASA